VYANNKEIEQQHLSNRFVRREVFIFAASFVIQFSGAGRKVEGNHPSLTRIAS
jgi:hypothetical protein